MNIDTLLVNRIRKMNLNRQVETKGLPKMYASKFKKYGYTIDKTNSGKH